MRISAIQSPSLPTIQESCEHKPAPTELTLFQEFLRELQRKANTTNERALCENLLSQIGALAIFIQERSDSENSTSSEKSSPPSTPEKATRAVTQILSPLPLLDLNQFKKA